MAFPALTRDRSTDRTHLLHSVKALDLVSIVLKRYGSGQATYSSSRDENLHRAEGVPGIDGRGAVSFDRYEVGTSARQQTRLSTERQKLASELTVW